MKSSDTSGAESSGSAMPSFPSKRRHSMEPGWLSGWARRPSIDLADIPPDIIEGKTLEPLQPTNGDSSTFNTIQVPSSAHAHPEADQGAVGRRKSESVIWRWFTTPMPSNDASPMLDTVSSIADVAMKLPTHAQSQTHVQQLKPGIPDNTSDLLNLDPSKYGGLKMTRNLSSRDLNALSPSNW